MNYQEYTLSRAEFVKEGLLYVALDGALSALFYRSVIPFVLFLPGFYWFLKERKKSLGAKQRQRLLQGFLVGMQYVSASLAAGYSVENAFMQALTELKKLYQEEEGIAREFYRLANGMKVNQSMETLLLQFAQRSGLEDIRLFAEVFAAARKSGGNLIAIIQNTVVSMTEKEETRQEIEVCLAAKKTEQKVMSVVPAFLICYVSAASPGFLDVMYGNPAGILIMSVCLGIYIAAFIIGRKIVEIEI